MKKQNIKFLLVLLVFGILLAWTTHAQQTPEQIEIAKKARNSTVRLVSEWNGHPIGDGSGFFVEHNQIVTNIHVVAGADKVAVKLVGKETGYTIEGVTAFDAKNDLVILQTTEKNGKPLTLRDSNSIEPGTSIFAVGTPKDGEEGHITQGTFHSVRKSDGKLRLKTIISPGNSGGPVLSWKKAEAIGVVVASSGKINVSYAIPSNILRELLKRRRSDDDANLCMSGGRGTQQYSHISISVLLVRNQLMTRKRLKMQSNILTKLLKTTRILLMMLMNTKAGYCCTVFVIIKQPLKT